MKTAASVASIPVLIALILAGCATKLSPASLAQENIPAIKKDCTVCHTSHDIAGKTAALKKPLQELCIDCHADRAAPNEHKVGVAPQAAVKTLPLKDGKITCITCHDPHKGTYRKMLRVPPKDLCITCHNK